MVKCASEVALKAEHPNAAVTTTTTTTNNNNNNWPTSQIGQTTFNLCRFGQKVNSLKAGLDCKHHPKQNQLQPMDLQMQFVSFTFLDLTGWPVHHPLLPHQTPGPLGVPGGASQEALRVHGMDPDAPAFGQVLVDETKGEKEETCPDLGISYFCH